MSKLDVTTHDLLQRLGPTSHLRSTRADLLFRRLRFDAQDQITEALMRAPKRIDTSAIDKQIEKSHAPVKRPLRRNPISKD